MSSSGLVVPSASSAARFGERHVVGADTGARQLDLFRNPVRGFRSMRCAWCVWAWPNRTAAAPSPASAPWPLGERRENGRQGVRWIGTSSVRPPWTPSMRTPPWTPLPDATRPPVVGSADDRRLPRAARHCTNVANGVWARWVESNPEALLALSSRQRYLAFTVANGSRRRCRTSSSARCASLPPSSSAISPAGPTAEDLLRIFTRYLGLTPEALDAVPPRLSTRPRS